MARALSPFRGNDAIEARRDARARDDDIVFVAVTRPAMFWGTPIESFALIPPGAFLAMALGDNPLWGALAGGAAFVACRALAEWDPHFARRIFLAARTKGRALNIATWGGPSLSPRPPGRPLLPSQIFVQGWTEITEKPGLLARLAAAMEARR